MRLLYNVALHVIALFLLPQALFKRKLRSALGRGFPRVEGEKIVWIHAVSMGETRAVVPLAKELHAQGWHVLFSNTTHTGHAEAKRSFPRAIAHTYLPFDLPSIIGPLVKRVAPQLVVISETDFWLNFHTHAKKSGATIVAVSAKLSERSAKRHALFPAILRSVDLFCVQSEEHKARFEKIVDPAKVVVCGNLKLDGEKIERRELGKTLTLGSTHDPEEKIWIAALPKIWEKHPDLRVYLVPRHPERFSKVADLLREAGLEFGLYSKGEEGRLVLVDAMGKLREFYAQSELSFVGGTFAPKVGGHNLLEPAFYGSCVLHGPHVWGQKEMASLLKGASVELKGELAERVIELVDSPEIRKEYVERACQRISESQGSLERTIEVLQKRLPNGRLNNLSRDGAVVSSSGS